MDFFYCIGLGKGGQIVLHYRVLVRQWGSVSLEFKICAPLTLGLYILLPPLLDTPWQVVKVSLLYIPIVHQKPASTGPLERTTSHFSPLAH